MLKVKLLNSEHRVYTGTEFEYINDVWYINIDTLQHMLDFMNNGGDYNTFSKVSDTEYILFWTDFNPDPDSSFYTSIIGMYSR